MVKNIDNIFLDKNCKQNFDKNWKQIFFDKNVKQNSFDENGEKNFLDKI